MFQVGDRVRLIKFPESSVGTVIGICNHLVEGAYLPIEVEFGNKDRYSLCFKENELELVDSFPSYGDGWNDGFKAGVESSKRQIQDALGNITDYPSEKA